jgi:hypothetical protein
LNFHALTRTKLKFMAVDHVSFGGGSVNQYNCTPDFSEPGILVVGRELTRAYSFQVFARPSMIEGTTDQEPQSLSDLRGRVTQ